MHYTYRLKYITFAMIMFFHRIPQLALLYTEYLLQGILCEHTCCSPLLWPNGPRINTFMCDLLPDYE